MRSSSIIGRAYASPTIVIMLARSRAAVARMVRTSNGRASSWSTTVAPMFVASRAVHWAATCISGDVGNQVPAPWRARARSLASSMSSAPPIPATKMSPCRHITAFGWPVVPPVHAMYRSSGELATVTGEAAPRVRASSASSAPARARSPALAPELDQEVEVVDDAAELVVQAVVVHHAPRPDAAEQIADLARGVVVVHVARHDPRLPATEERLDVLGRVVRQDRDAVLAGLPPLELVTLAERAEPASGEERRQRPGVVVHLPVGAPFPVVHEHDAVGDLRAHDVVHVAQRPLETHARSTPTGP